MKVDFEYLVDDGGWISVTPVSLQAIALWNETLEMQAKLLPTEADPLFSALRKAGYRYRKVKPSRKSDSALLNALEL